MRVIEIKKLKRILDALENQKTKKIYEDDLEKLMSKFGDECFYDRDKNNFCIVKKGLDY